ncbi:AraC family transcriptional regulator [Aequorivita sp. CIP111184]|uniref:helix-turn-helix domain-containing protein n=1 Tax=Aequorivita sp. CIP111184 TaxID=2211356 RepID=UPI000DBBB9E6|nr:helix-turn-helix domain-containing protein [Aequorivita sp. CIP111184]SRX52323.1 Bifunctional transcriptional activator/DNA repair enzyme AdaA [Aequorivita sp. CIP111184]
MKINILYSIVLAAILQGFWLSFFILFTKKFNTKAAKFLGLLILAVTLTQLQYFLGEIGIISWRQFNAIHLPYEFLQAPFLYFFVSFYLYPNKIVRNIEKALFIPAAFFLMLTLLYKIIAFTTIENWKDQPVLKALANINVYYGEVVNLLLLFIVVAASLYKLFTQDRNTKTYNTKIISAELVWLKILLLVILIVILSYSYYVFQFFIDANASYFLVDITVSILIYALGYIGIQKMNIIKERENIRMFNRSHQQLYSVVEDSKNENISKIVEIVINKQRFLDPNFSSDTLADELQLSKSHLSRIFNNEMNVSFTDYINTLRVEEAKKHLQTPEFSNYTLVAIGLEAGFNSKTTFNTTFKKITGQTPSQFKKTVSN